MNLVFPSAWLSKEALSLSLIDLTKDTVDSRPVTINKGITWEKRSRAQRTNKNAAHMDPREVVRPRIADEGPKEPPKE